jgi:hypothetical protein
MPKAETTFRPIGDSDKKMHGHPGVLISGFSHAEQSLLLAQFEEWGLDTIPLIVIGADTLPLTLEQASALPAKTNLGETPELPRAVIMSGLQEKQLNALMRGYREKGLPRPLWASVTAHSSQWTVKYLLVELLKEREAMRQAMLAEQQNKTPPKDKTE